MSADTTKTDGTDKDAKNAGGATTNPARQQRVISNPNDVASVVLMQIDAVNAKKDDLTIAIKGLSDTTKQLVRVYADHAKAIQRLQQRIEQLEKAKESA